MRITIAQLEAFYWISRLGSFREAAKHLRLAQPTISLRIRDLEEALGQKLFSRDGRNFRLTSDGEALLNGAGGVVAQVQQILERAGVTHAVGGVVRLGTPETFALVCLPQLLQLVEEKHPTLKVELDIGTSSALTDDLAAGRIDVAFVADPLIDPRMRIKPLGKHRMVWAASPSIPLPGVVRPADLRTIPVITNPAPAPQYRLLLDWFASQGVTPLRHSYCNSVIVIAHLVRAGFGVSLLPLTMIRDDVESGRLLVLKCEPDVPPSLMYACRSTTGTSANVEAVIDAAQQVLRMIPFLEPL